MSRHWKQDSGDSYQGGWDYEGLQVDTRAQDSTDKHLDMVKAPPKPKKQRESHDIYLHEKEIRVEDERPHDSPTSMESPMDSTLTSAMAGTTMVPETPSTPAKVKILEDELPLPPEPKPRRICGMRKRSFWILFIVLLALIVAAALIGGIVGGMKRSSSTTSAPVAPAAPAAPTATIAPTVSGPLLQEDVVVDSPLNVISYVNPSNGDPASKQTFRMYFQTAFGNIKESVSDALGPWQTATPIFTDAINNTGLATITYLNGTQQQATIFYVDVNQNLQEKRKMFSDTAYWEQRKLKYQLQLQVRGNISVAHNDDNDPVNEWDGYRIAAVHSPAFLNGPQARVFYRSVKMDNSGSSMIQELIWDQKNDNWSKGANFTTAWPTSHIAATIDESTNILRLFFSTGNRTLQEYWTDITTPETKYQEGLSFPNFLTHNNADISAVSFNGTTYIYHVLPGSNNTIHETQITGIPRSINNQETFNSSNILVVKPSSISTQGKAIYQPFAAAKTNVTGLPTKFFLFWADNLVGMNSTNGLEGGYAQINSIPRNATDPKWPAQQGGPVDQVPLGKNNASPS